MLEGRALIDALRGGGYVLYIRHTATDFGENDAAMTTFDDCSKQRNLTEYSGDIIPDSAIAECLAQAEALYAATRKWLKANKPELL